MWKNLCDFSDAYMLVSRTISVENTISQGADENNNNKKLVFKSSILCSIY